MVKFKKGDRVQGKAGAGIFKGLKGIVKKVYGHNAKQGYYGLVSFGKKGSKGTVAVWLKYFKKVGAKKGAGT